MIVNEPLCRWPLCSSGSAAASLAERKAALLKLSLEAATCAQRDRFAEQPARAVAAAAATTAATADYIIQVCAYYLCELSVTSEHMCVVT